MSLDLHHTAGPLKQKPAVLTHSRTLQYQQQSFNTLTHATVSAAKPQRLGLLLSNINSHHKPKHLQICKHTATRGTVTLTLSQDPTARTTKPGLGQVGEREREKEMNYCTSTIQILSSLPSCPGPLHPLLSSSPSPSPSLCFSSPSSCPWPSSSCPSCRPPCRPGPVGRTRWRGCPVPSSGPRGRLSDGQGNTEITRELRHGTDIQTTTLLAVKAAFQEPRKTRRVFLVPGSHRNSPVRPVAVLPVTTAPLIHESNGSASQLPDILDALPTAVGFK